MLTTMLLGTTTASLAIGAHGSIVGQQPSESAEAQAVSISDFGWSAATPAEVEEIRRLIEGFQSISKPFMGASEFSSGFQFTPTHKASVDALLFGAPACEVELGYERVVGFGPKAIPGLLEALDDRRPTRLTIRHNGSFGVMQFDDRLFRNPLNPLDGNARQSHVSGGTSEHVLTVGEIAFVALGEIVNRPYSAVQYRPTACIDLCSPQHDPWIGDMLRQTWGHADPAARLFASLMVDLGSPSDEAEPPMLRIGWFQSGAATRLAFYFPETSARFISAILGSFRIKSQHAEESVKVSAEYELAEFIDAISCDHSPTVIATLTDILRETDSPQVLLALWGVGFDGPTRTRLFVKSEAAVRRGPSSDIGPFGSECYLMERMLDVDEARGIALCREYIDKGTLMCSWTALKVFASRVALTPGATRVLSEMLEDERETPEGYELHSRIMPIRVCDAAASILSRGIPDLHFDLKTERTRLDEQIQAMRVQLSRRESTK